MTEYPTEGRRAHRGEPCLADAADGEGMHRPRSPEHGDVDRRIEHGQRGDALGMSDGPFETDWAADVVYHKMAAIDPECVDRLAGPSGQAAPGVVEIAGPPGQSETGEVEGNAAQPPGGQLCEHLSVEERTGRHAVQTYHRCAVASLEDEAANPGCFERLPGQPMTRDHVGNIATIGGGSHSCAPLLIPVAPGPCDHPSSPAG